MDRGTHLYLAGPMTGYEDYNRPAFDHAAARLRRQGFRVTSPPELDLMDPAPAHLTEDEAWTYYLKRDLPALVKCQAVVVLPGWEDSRGATLEVDTAERVGLDLYAYAPDTVPSLAPLSPPLLVGITGVARAGKDTLGGFLVEDHGFTRVGFADALKDIARRVGWDGNKDTSHPLGHRSVFGYPLFPPGRVFLQNLGLAVREVLGESTWVDHALDKAERIGGRVVITDVRFDNEAQAIRDRGGVVLRVTRPGVGAANDHVSERGVSDDLVDLTVGNDSTLERLRANAGVVLSVLGLND